LPPDGGIYRVGITHEKASKPLVLVPFLYFSEKNEKLLPGFDTQIYKMS